MISIHRYSLPLAAAFVSSKGSITHRECTLVRLSAGPSCGLGEASPMLGLCPDPLDQVQAELDALDGAAPGLPRSLSDLDSWTDSLAQTSAVKHALGSALIDCMAQANGRSIATLLNPKARRDVPISHLYTDDDTLLHAVMLGTQTIKIKVGIAPLTEENDRLGSSDFPNFDRNHNTGKPYWSDTQLKVARQTVFHDAERASRLILPVIPR